MNRVITVADIISLPVFTSVNLAVPCEGALGRQVRNVGILDCPPDYNEYHNYFPGEFIITNLGFAYNNPTLAEKSLLAMMRRGVAGIAVKQVYNAPISRRVLQESVTSGVPLYVYDGKYHESIAYQSLNLLQRDQEQQDKARLLDELLERHNVFAMRKKFNTIAEISGSMLHCFVLVLPKNDTCSLYALLDGVMLVLQPEKSAHHIEDFHAMCYRDRIVVFVTEDTLQAPWTRHRSQTTEDKKDAEAPQCCIARLATLGTLHIGVSLPLPIEDSDLAIRQALLAAQVAYEEGNTVRYFARLCVRAFAHAASGDRLFMSVSDVYNSILQTYDKAHATELLETARLLAQTCGDTKVVARHLYQHPNTIRYRIKKIKALFGIDADSDRSLIYVLQLIFLPQRESLAASTYHTFS